MVAYELIRLPDRKTILGLNAVGARQPGRSYSAQLASQAGIFTNVNLINSTGQSRRVVLSAIQADGSGIGQPQTRTLAAGQQFSIDAGALFGAAAAAQDCALAAGFVGSLIVEADSDGVLGDVIFGDPDNFRYAAGLHL